MAHRATVAWAHAVGLAPPKGPTMTGVIMKKTALGILAGTAAAAALVLAMPGSASAMVGSVGADNFESNGTVKDGHYWVHQDTESATWTFNITSLASADKNTVYLNIDALVSNKVGGGSGYSANGVKFVASCGSAKQILTVKLVNGYRPIYSGDSLGVGQAASGHSSAALKTSRFAGCTQLTVRTTGAYPQERAIGFIKTSATLGYS
ncbi:MAG: hypothetical protein ACR2KE_08505 [Candidatus Nanopelagicales bacterium]